jgi:hypothetical protein
MISRKGYFEFGGRERVRTADPLGVNEMLSQLSYAPLKLLFEMYQSYLAPNLLLNCFGCDC